jgi:hypothetical protein
MAYIEPKFSSPILDFSRNFAHHSLLKQYYKNSKMFMEFHASYKFFESHGKVLGGTVNVPPRFSFFSLRKQGDILVSFWTRRIQVQAVTSCQHESPLKRRLTICRLPLRKVPEMWQTG